jgi:hypothetical protein
MLMDIVPGPPGRDREMHDNVVAVNWYSFANLEYKWIGFSRESRMNADVATG